MSGVSRRDLVIAGTKTIKEKKEPEGRTIVRTTGSRGTSSTSGSSSFARGKIGRPGKFVSQIERKDFIKAEGGRSIKALGGPLGGSSKKKRGRPPRVPLPRKMLRRESTAAGLHQTVSTIP